ncbi:hypothetical protein [Clostridium perfringens]|uniref:hypothetical protein n=1 Tax=Clostridium perfringens TaxID=1502 RepID=UPI0006C3FBA7|nr:hypothetical protein [Clostridium perfringens]ELC8427321.1 hypothetical protein [Clostridium perfringens]MDG6891854.1 hypothetical protein [Clostridium perfringens]WEV19956.1 hypothetical protein PL323_04820 [Clostridium perfringens D]CUO17042.1 Uncharacterised protein [Clostridium perfringens]
MKNIDFFKVLTILGAVFTFIIAYFDKEHKKSIDLKEEYFKKILVPYVNKYRENKEINIIEFLKEQIDENSCFIPPYILFLVDNKNEIALHKVLIIDYKKNFPNSKNNIFNTLSRIDRITELIFIISLIVLGSIALILMVEILILILLEMANFFINGYINDIRDIIEFIVVDLGLILIWGFIFMFRKENKFKKLKNSKFFRKLKKFLIEIDEYSNSIEDIKNIINNKIQVYNKNENYEYIK